MKWTVLAAIGLLAAALIVAVVVVVSQHGRISELEREVEEQAQATPTSAAVVTLSRAWLSSGSCQNSTSGKPGDWFILYAIGGTEGRVCVDAGSECATTARVGYPLPSSCPEGLRLPPQ